MEAYTHGLAADWRARHAMSTADKTGGAFTGWRPKRSRPVARFALAGALLAAVSWLLMVTL